MERVTGQTLLSLWPNLVLSENEAIVTALREYFNELRRLPAPKYYSSVGERYLLDELFWTSDIYPTINGPFASHEMIIETIVRISTTAGRHTGQSSIAVIYHAFSATAGTQPLRTLTSKGKTS